MTYRYVKRDDQKQQRLLVATCLSRKSWGRIRRNSIRPVRSGTGRRGTCRTSPIGLRHSRDSEPTAWHGLRRNKHEAIFLFRRRRAETIRDQRRVRWGFVLVGIANAYAQSDCSFSRCGNAGLTICGRARPRSASRHHRVSLIETTRLAT